MTGRARRRGRGAGTVAAVTAVGLVALSGPATEVAVVVTAVRTAVPAAAAAATADAPVVVVPEPVAPVAPAPVTTIDIPRPRPVEVQLRPAVPHGVTPETAPPPATCGGHHSPRQIHPGVLVGPRSATVGWQADGHADVRRYRVQAVSQQLVAGPQPAPPAQIAAQPAGCEPVSVTFPGLTRGAAYVFWLEEEVPDTWGVLRWVQVGTSEVVVVG